MLNIIRKLTSLFMTVIMMASFFAPTAVSASKTGYEEAVETEVKESTVEDILSSFYEKALSTGISNEVSTYSTESAASISHSLRQQTVDELIDAGFEAYNVTGDNFYAVEQALATDLEEVGLRVDGAYIVVVSGENQQEVSTYDVYGGTAGSSFTYTSNGTTYTMRYLTVTAADIPQYGQVTTVNLLNSKSQTAIANCLNTAVNLYLSDLWKPLGIIASLVGLDITDFGTAETSTLYMHCGTNWTRVFTQVYDAYYDDWTYGSCVEKAAATSYYSGLYYSASENTYVTVPESKKTVWGYCENYYNYTWRKEQAIIGAASAAVYDLMGPIKYSYNGTVKVTHNNYYY